MDFRRVFRKFRGKPHADHQPSSTEHSPPTYASIVGSSDTGKATASDASTSDHLHDYKCDATGGHKSGKEEKAEEGAVEFQDKLSNVGAAMISLAKAGKREYLTEATRNKSARAIMSSAIEDVCDPSFVQELCKTYKEVEGFEPALQIAMNVARTMLQFRNGHFKDDKSAYSCVYREVAESARYQSLVRSDPPQEAFLTIAKIYEAFSRAAKAKRTPMT